MFYFTIAALPISMLLPISSRVASQAARPYHVFHVLLPHGAFMVEKFGYANILIED
jgi:hypothetical protein